MTQTLSWFVTALATVVLLAGCARAPDATAPRAEAPATGSPATVPQDDAGYRAALEQWRSERETRLRDPDGWLSFAGSGQVSPGAQRVGAGADNAIVLPGGPAHWGVLYLAPEGTLRFDAAPGSDVTVAGAPFATAPLATQLDEGGPTRVQAGDLAFYVVRTGDVHGWRFRDPQSPSLRAFAGVPHFPVDPSWRIDARWEAFPEPRTLQLVTSNGTPAAMPVPGRATFERDGRTYTLLPVLEPGDDTLFFILADRTSGKDTYGGGRFLYAAPPAGDTVELDFNKALNPPCALNGHVVCPLAPPENRLDLAVTAGETTYPLKMKKSP